MVGARFIVGAVIAWLILLATAGMLFRGRGKNKNPLDWPEVDRCLFLVCIFFFLGVVFNTTSGITHLLYGGSPSYMNRAFLGPFMQVLRVLALGWLGLLLMGVWLRRKTTENETYTHMVVQFSALFTALFCYMWGGITEIGPWLFAMALGAFHLLLFKPHVALPWIPTFLIIVTASQIAVWLDLVPYSPIFGRPPFVGGKPIPLHWIISLCWAIMTFIFMLLLMKFVVVRWREREAEVGDMTSLLKKMFGRYLSTEVMKSILENPAALEMGGERRRVTIMMTDLRGFTALSERLQPEQVVQMLNTYFELMVEVVLKYNGTINEIVGDALLVVFGAPQEMPDRAERAIACAIEMQNTVTQVNDQNLRAGLPELEMGIGLNDADVVVGNIGSSKRSKYAVVGSGVNLTSRIESYTVGGQILISDSLRQEVGEIVRIDGQRDVIPKGSEAPIRIYEVGGIAGSFHTALEERTQNLVRLVKQIPLQCHVLEEVEEDGEGCGGIIQRLSRRAAELDLEKALEPLTNIKMNLLGVEEELAVRNFYGKVLESYGRDRRTHLVRFTSVPPELSAYFQAHRQHAAEG